MSAAQRRRVRRIVGVTHLVLALVTALVVTVAYRNLDGNIADGETIQHVVAPPTEPTQAPQASGSDEQPEEAAPLKPLNILVMGTDTREGKGNSIDGEEGEGGSDTTILIHVSADRQSAYGVSLPRDALVTRPDCRTADGETIPGASLQMFNTAFAEGGPQCTVQTVESLTGVYIDHYLVLDFNGFQDMVEAVDGVEVCIPEQVSDPAHGIFFDAGVQTLTGRQALNYVRERYVLSQTGDIGRMRRQQAFIASMINKVVSAGTLARPTRVYGFLDAATSSIVVDDELDSVSKLLDLTLQFQDTGLADIKFLTVPFEAYAPDPNRLVWTSDARALWKRIRQDRPLGARFSQDSLSAADSVGTVDGKRSGGRKGGKKGATSTAPAPTPDEAEERRAAGLCA